jgi:acetyl-CoA acetyltransferase
MTSNLRGRTAVVGVGHYGIGEIPGHNPIEIMAGATRNALADAGLSLKDVDGVFAGSAVHFMPSVSLSEHLGIRPRHVDSTMLGGASFVAHTLQAAMALNAGLCNVALIAYGSNQRTGSGKLVAGTEPDLLEAPYNPRQPITAYALAASRHMHLFGTTREQMAAVAVAARAWANLNPEAFARGPLAIDDVLRSRMISDPLSVLDCCLVTDGGGAVIMVRADRAPDCARPPVYMLGGGTEITHMSIANMPDITVTGALESGRRAREMARVDLSDIDLVEVYDAFTINTILFLEDLGFCPKGEGGRFVGDGNIAPGGGLPVNTNGGGLSCVHPGMYGIFLVIEGVRQLRHEAGDRQVLDAQVAMIHGNGGRLSVQSTSIFGTAATL